MVCRCYRYVWFMLEKVAIPLEVLKSPHMTKKLLKKSKIIAQNFMKRLNYWEKSCIFGRQKLDSFQMRFIRIDQCDGPRAEIIYVCWVFCLSPLDVYVCKKHFFFWFSEHRAHTCEHDIKSDLFRADSTTHNSSGIFNLVSSKAICNRHSACLVPASQAAEAAAGLSYYSFGQNVRSVKCKLE